MEWKKHCSLFAINISVLNLIRIFGTHKQLCTKVGITF